MKNGIEVDIPAAQKEPLVCVDKGRVQVLFLVPDSRHIQLDDMVALCDVYLSLCVTKGLSPTGLLEGRLAQYRHEQAVIKSIRSGG